MSDLYTFNEMYPLYDLGATSCQAQEILDRIAPAIAAQALREAALVVHDPECPGCITHSKYESLARFLRERANQIGGQS